MSGFYSYKELVGEFFMIPGMRKIATVGGMLSSSIDDNIYNLLQDDGTILPVETGTRNSDSHHSFKPIGGSNEDQILIDVNKKCLQPNGSVAHLGFVDQTVHMSYAEYLILLQNLLTEKKNIIKTFRNLNYTEKTNKTREMTVLIDDIKAQIKIVESKLPASTSAEESSSTPVKKGKSSKKGGYKKLKRSKTNKRSKKCRK